MRPNQTARITIHLFQSSGKNDWYEDLFKNDRGYTERVFCAQKWECLTQTIEPLVRKECSWSAHSSATNLEWIPITAEGPQVGKGKDFLITVWNWAESKMYGAIYLLIARAREGCNLTPD